MEGDERNDNGIGEKRDTPMERRGMPCPGHEKLVAQVDANESILSELKTGQRGIKSTLDAIQAEFIDIKNSVWGPNRSNGLVGRVSGLSGAFKVIIGLLSILVILYGYNIRQASMYMKALEAHGKEPAHAVMGEKALSLTEKIDGLVISTDILAQALHDHIDRVREQHPEVYDGE